MDHSKQQNASITQAQAEEAVHTSTLGRRNPTREGLLDTPRRVVEAYGDWFSGYREDPHDYLQRTFEEISGYDEMIVLT